MWPSGHLIFFAAWLSDIVWGRKGRRNSIICMTPRQYRSPEVVFLRSGCPQPLRIPVSRIAYYRHLKGCIYYLGNLLRKCVIGYIHTKVFQAHKSDVVTLEVRQYRNIGADVGRPKVKVGLISPQSSSSSCCPGQISRLVAYIYTKVPRYLGSQ